jgi:RHS repeat-associated protein
MTEADGVVTAYAYDPLYRLAVVTQNARPGQPETVDVNVITRYGYDAAGNLVEISDANGNPTRFAFDGLNRLMREVDAIGNTWDYTYDKVRNRIARVDALRNRTTYAYYDDNQLKRIDYHDGTFVTYTYDQNNNQMTIANELGSTRRSYDKLNRLTEEIDVFGRRTAFIYDPVGNRLAISYPDGRTVNSSYYKNDWLKTTSDPEGRVTTYTRDRVGNLVRQDNTNSTVVTQTYDKADRLLTLENRQVGGAGTVNSRFVYTYDAVGQRVTMEATYAWRQPAVETSRYSYDPLRRLVRDEDSQGRWTAYTFDRVGNRLTLTTNDDSLSSRPFDAKTLSYSYNAINQLLTVVGDTRPGSAGMQRTDNVAQPIHAFRHEVAAQQDKGISEPAAADLLARADALLADLYGTPAPQASAVADAVAALRTQVQAYQAQGALRNDGIATSLLTKLKLADDANTSVSGDLQAVTYTYDANGNRINKGFPGPQGPRVQGTDYSYDPENRLVRAQDYQQNLQGNRVDRTVTTMDHDGEGRRLVKVYDPKDGSGGAQRVEYVFDGLGPIAEYNTQNPQHDNYYRGDMGRILERHHFPSGAAGQAFWYHYDGLGSVAGLTKQDGQSSHNYRYEPYGQIELPNGNFTDPHNHYTFTGQEGDEHTGLYDFFARQYDPDAGVWVTQDAYRGQIVEPRSLHRYQYVYNNPLTLLDHYGFSTDELKTEDGYGYSLIEGKLYYDGSLVIEQYQIQTPNENFIVSSNNPYLYGNDSQLDPINPSLDPFNFKGEVKNHDDTKDDIANKNHDMHVVEGGGYLSAVICGVSLATIETIIMGVVAAATCGGVAIAQNDVNYKKQQIGKAEEKYLQEKNKLQDIIKKMKDWECQQGRDHDRPLWEIKQDQDSILIKQNTTGYIDMNDPRLRKEGDTYIYTYVPNF